MVFRFLISAVFGLFNVENCTYSFDWTKFSFLTLIDEIINVWLILKEYKVILHSPKMLQIITKLVYVLTNKLTKFQCIA